MDTAPVLEPAEHVLDLVALSVERPVVGDRHLAVDLRRYAGRDALCGQGASKPVGVIAAIRGRSSTSRIKRSSPAAD